MEHRRIFVGWLAALGLLMGCNGGGAGDANDRGTSLPASAFSLVFVADSGANELRTYSLTDASGALAQVGNPAATGTAPAAVALSPNGHFVYVANQQGNSISAFSINTATGALTALPATTVGAQPKALAMDPSANLLFVANSADGTVGAYFMDPGTGALTAAGSPTTVGAGPGALAVDPIGHHLYVANAGDQNVAAYGINTGTGALTALSGSPVALGTRALQMVIDPAATHLFAAEDLASQVGVLALNGLGQPGAPQNATLSASPTYLGFAGAGFLLVGSATQLSVYTVGAGGALTPVAGSPLTVAAGISAVRLDPTGKYLLATSSTSNQLYVYGFDIATGAVSAPAGAPTAPTGFTPVAITAVHVGS